MAIPNLSLKYEVRNKVRIGEKKVSSGGKEYPAAVDHFVSPDPEVQGEPKVIRIILPHAEVEDNFSTGMEWWVKASGKNQLACYTKDSGSKPVALRLPPYVSEGDEVLGEARGGQGRIPIVCPFRSCPMMIDKRCKPMGRLVFFVEGGRTDSVLQLDTKSWNSIEALTATLTGSRIGGPLTGRTFELSVAFEQKGRDRFPVLSLTEADVEINSPADAGMVDAYVTWEQAGDAEPRVVLARMLDQVFPEWRGHEPTLAWVREKGVEACIESLRARVEA